MNDQENFKKILPLFTSTFCRGIFIWKLAEKKVSLPILKIVI